MTKPKANPDARIIKPTTLRIDKPGAYPDIGEDDYHGDPVVVPSLSASIAHILVEQTPRHALVSHARLNPDLVRERAEHLDIGDGLHALLLEGRDKFHIIGADSFRTDAAKAERAWAWENGRLPILADKFPAIEAMLEAARGQIAAHEDLRVAFSDFEPEVTLIWCEGEGEDRVWFRCRLDAKPRFGNIYPDIKTSGSSVAPGPYQRHAYDYGYDLRAAFYRRGIRAVLGVPNPIYALVAIEKKEPYALAVYDFDAEAMHIADQKVEMAIARWRWCMKNNRWPGYRKHMLSLEPPVYVSREWERRMIQDAVDHEQRLALNQVALEWQGTGAPKQLPKPANDEAPTEAA